MSLLPLVLVWSASVSAGCLKNSSLQSAHVDFIFFAALQDLSLLMSVTVLYTLSVWKKTPSQLCLNVYSYYDHKLVLAAHCVGEPAGSDRGRLFWPLIISLYRPNIMLQKKTRLKFHFRNSCPRRRPRAEGQRADGSTVLITEASCHRLFDFNV